MIMSCFKDETRIYWVAGLISIVLSIWLAASETVVNTDAICYLLSAQEIGHSSIAQAMQVCGQAKWPFYPILIYSLAKFTHLSYAVAAYSLNALFSLMTVLVFIRLVKALGGKPRELLLAALVILFWHNFNGVREYIIRDHGFWAFYLLSVLCLLQFFNHPKWRYALAFSASLGVATLFRIEGGVFFILLPFLALFKPQASIKQRLYYFFMLNLPVLLSLLAGAGWLLTHAQQTLENLGRVNEIVTHLQHGISIIADKYQQTKLALAQHVLGPESKNDINLVFLLVILSWYLISVISNLSPVYALLTVYAAAKKYRQALSNSGLVLIGYVIINFLVTFSFLIERLFLSKRYLIAFSLILLLGVPFALSMLIADWSKVRHKVAVSALGLFMLASAIGGVFNFGYSKAYIHHAGAWLADNTPKHARVYSNDIQVMYYSRHFGNEIFDKFNAYNHLEKIAHEQWKQYDYLALRFNKQNEKTITNIAAELNKHPIQVFKNARGDRVEIYANN